MRDSPYAFVALGPANRVAVVNTNTFEIEKYIVVGRRVWQLAFNQDQSLLLTTNGVSGDVSVINTETLNVEKTVKVGRYPWGIAVKWK
jgi:YVTN family beta-propeller protein